MTSPVRYRIVWVGGSDRLEALEPTTAEVAHHAGQLAQWYNEDHNRTMMAHASELSPMDVRRQFHAMSKEGSRPFLLFQDGQLVGDADFRRLEGTTGEFAIMIGARHTQGKGLGTRFTLMLHTFAFRTLGLSVAYLSIVPANLGGRRCYEKVGYVEDAGDSARAYCDAAQDIAMSLTRERFDALHAGTGTKILVTPRDRVTGGARP